MGRASGWIAAEEKPVVVLGAGGLLAKAIVDTLEDQDHHYVALSESSLDITYEGRVRVLLKGLNPGIVINAAGYTDIDGAEENPERAFEVNGAGAGNVAGVCAELGALVVHVSTDYVFDGTGLTVYLPEDKPEPVNVYGKSKLEGERLVREKAENHLIVRTSLLFGAGGNNLVNTLFEGERAPMEIPVDRIVSPTYTRHFADGMIRLAGKGARGTFHLCNHGRCSLYAFAREVVRQGKGKTAVYPVHSRSIRRPAARILNGALDCSSSYDILGSPLPPWEAALSEYIGS